MHSKKLTPLYNISFLVRVLPFAIILFFLVSGWYSFINFYNALTEGGIKAYEIKVDDRVYTYKVNEIAQSVVEVFVFGFVGFCSIYFYSWVVSLKRGIINGLIQTAIEDKLTFEELIKLRLYFGEDPIAFKEQLILINLKLELVLA